MEGEGLKDRLLMIGETGLLTIQVMQGRNLVPCDKNGLSDPFVEVSVGKKKKRTKHIRKTLNPDWSTNHPNSSRMEFLVDHNTPSKLKFEVFDWNAFKGPVRMGKFLICDVSRPSIKGGKVFDDWYRLVPSKEGDAVRGDVKVNATLTVMGKADMEAMNKRMVSTKESSTSLYKGDSPSSASSGADSFSDSVAESPLRMAINLSEYGNVIDLLEKEENINVQDKAGYTHLHAAACLFSEVDDMILQAVLEHPKVDVNSRNTDGNTPLHYFCGKHRSPSCGEAFNLFLVKGADVNAANNWGETPLHKSVMNPSVRVMMMGLLIDAGVDVNHRNLQGYSALHYAVRLGRMEDVLTRDQVINVLLAAGANTDIRGDDGLSPHEWAVENKIDSVADRLTAVPRVASLLGKLGLRQYSSLIFRDDLYFPFPARFESLTDEELEDKGISDSAHRQAILDGVKKGLHLSEEELQENERQASLKKDSQSDLKEDSQPPQQPDQVEPSSDDLLESTLHKLSGLQNKNWIIQNNELEFTKKLGAGQFATVYMGRYKSLMVAIKVLKTDQSEKEQDEFKKEFEVMSKESLRSPHLVFFFGAVLKPKMCMVMEFCHRGSLYDVLNVKDFQCTWDRVFSFSREMCLGLDVLHHHDPVIYHRDIKSLNLLINRSYKVKLGDFGLARFDRDTAKETLHQMRGTFAYAAPEVYHGQTFSVRSDIFSCALVLWELAYRSVKGDYLRPYGEYPQLKMAFQIIIKTAKQGLRPTIPEECPKMFADLITDCWDAEPTSRPDCQGLIQRIAECEKNYKENPDAWSPS